MSGYKARQTTCSSPFPGPAPPHTTAQGPSPTQTPSRPGHLLGRCSKGHTGWEGRDCTPGAALLSAHLRSDSFLSRPSPRDLGISRQMSAAFPKKTTHLHRKGVQGRTYKNHFMFNTHPQKPRGPQSMKAGPARHTAQEGGPGGWGAGHGVHVCTLFRGGPRPQSILSAAYFPHLVPTQPSPSSALLPGAVSTSSRTDVIPLFQSPAPSAPGISRRLLTRSAARGQLATLPPPSSSPHFPCLFLEPLPFDSVTDWKRV